MVVGSDLRFVASADGLERSGPGFCRGYHPDVFLLIPFHASQGSQYPGRDFFYNPCRNRFLASLAFAASHLLVPSRPGFRRYPGAVSAGEEGLPQTSAAADDPMGKSSWGV